MDVALTADISQLPGSGPGTRSRNVNQASTPFPLHLRETWSLSKCYRTLDLDILTTLCVDNYPTLQTRKLRSRMTHMLRPGPEPGVVAGLVLETKLCTLGRESHLDYRTWESGSLRPAGGPCALPPGILRAMVSKTPGCSGTGKPYPWGQEGERQGYMRLGAALLSQSLKAPSNGLSLMSSQLEDGLRAPSPSTAEALSSPLQG